MSHTQNFEKKMLIVGLGNPGFKYRRTRHNLGYRVVNRIASGYKVRFDVHEFYSLATVKMPGIKLYLLKPLTFMNRSGLAVAAFQRKHNISVKQILIVFDDMALPVGKIRLRPGGGDGGHNGLASVIENLNNAGFPRLRIGIGASGSDDVSRFVLSSFKFNERAKIKKAVDQACKSIETIINHGFEKAMNKFN